LQLDTAQRRKDVARGRDEIFRQRREDLRKIREASTRPGDESSAGKSGRSVLMATGSTVVGRCKL
jgi:hypothetical protein